MLDWQTVVAVGVVLAAASVIARRIWLWAHGQAGSACSGCPNHTTGGATGRGMVKTLPLIQLQTKHRSESPPHPARQPTRGIREAKSATGAQQNRS